jgi:DNA-binding transcriptional MerR regulator
MKTVNGQAMEDDGLMTDQGLMTIEELASQAGVATSTVRLYQSRGLLPPPERRGRIGYYGPGHLARLRLIAQLQEEGFSLAGIKRLTEAWENGRGLDDVLGLETQVAAAWAAEEPVRLEPAQFAELFSGQEITPAVIERALRIGLVAFDGGDIVVRSPQLLEIGSELARSGIPVAETLGEFEALQSVADSIAERFTAVFERHMWVPFVDAGLPGNEIQRLTASLQRLSALAESIVAVTLRDALRRKAAGFLAQQALRFDEAGVLDEPRPARDGPATGPGRH